MTPPRWHQVMDILDVWFDSGSTHTFTLEDRPDLKWPADVYLEGSDQHRGWFHSSLLESCGTRGRAPYDTVVTHGFTMDEDGRKMSKSLGNTVVPQDVIKQSGADILRLWVVTTDYWEDQRLGKNVLQTNVDAYRKLRNTIRWMLGTLAHDEGETVPLEAMPELERLMLHRLAELDEVVRAGYDAFEFKRVTRALIDFMVVELSAFYFDIRKDALYCDAPSSLRRKASVEVVRHLFDCLVKWWRRCCPSPWRRPGSTGIPTRNRCISSSSRTIPAGLEGRGAGGKMAQGAAGPPRRHRRAGDRAGEEGRSARRWRPRRSCTSPIPSCAPRSTASTSPRSPSPARSTVSADASAGRRLRARRRQGRRGRARPCHRHEMRALLALHRMMSARTRNIPMSRPATRRRCANWRRSDALITA